MVWGFQRRRPPTVDRRKEHRQGKTSFKTVHVKHRRVCKGFTPKLPEWDGLVTL